jgi:hypothetical protein
MPLKIPAGEGLSSIWQKFFQIVAKCCAATDLCLVPRQEWSERGASIVPACALACGRAARAPRGGTMGIDAEPRGGRVPRQEPGNAGKSFGLPAQGARARPWARMCNRYAVGGGGTRWAVGWTPVWRVQRLGDGFGMLDGEVADGFGTSGDLGGWEAGAGIVRRGGRRFGGSGGWAMGLVCWTARQRMGLARPATQGARARPWARMCNRYAVGGRGRARGVPIRCRGAGG